MGDYEQMVKGIRSEHGVHFLMDYMPAGFFRCSMDADKRVDLANRVMAELFGCRDEADFYAFTGGCLKGMVLEKDYEHALLEARRQTYQEKDILKTEFRITRKDGSTRWVDCRGRVIMGTEGKSWIYAIMLDDTDEKNQIRAYREKSRRDSLTGLLNREACREQITRYIKQAGEDGRGALMIIDMDNFKDVNDTMGHLFGDSVLTEASGCIKTVSGECDVVGRVGGDEFLLFLTDMESRKKVTAYARRIAEGISSICSPGESRMDLGCSIGVSLCPDDGEDFEQLFAKADIALYSGKNGGKGRCVFYEPSLTAVNAADWEGFSGRLPVKIDSEEGRVYSGDRLIHYVFKVLYESEDIREAINTILKIVGLQFNVSRAYIFEDSYDGRFMSNTFEWCNQGISRQIDRLQNMSYEKDAPGYRENFDRNGIFLCMDVGALAPIQRKELESQDIKAVLQCGIYDAGNLVGFIGFDECRENRRWTGEQAGTLAYVARIVGTFLLKDRAEIILKQRLVKLQNVLEDVTEQKQEEAPEVYDSLTNLRTAVAFEKQMDVYLQTDPEPGTTAAILLDMDNFQRVNEARGKLFGNVVLMNVASCLKRACRECDLIGRFGGDEFLVLLKNVNREEAGRAAETMSKDISAILAENQNSDMKISCSMGIRMISAEEKGFYDIMVKADQALHQAKKEGKGGIRFYESVADKADESFTCERLKQSNDEKLREQSSLSGKSSTAVALELFEKTSSFEEALHVLMGFLGGRFHQNRIVVYMNREGEDGRHAAYQWVDDRTAMLFDPTDSFRREEFYLAYHLYDSDGIAVLQKRHLKEYSAGTRKIIDRARARTMLFAGIFIDGAYAGMMVMVNTEEEREWTQTERGVFSEIARIVGTNAQSTLLLMEARQEAEYYKNKDSLTGLMSYERFKEMGQGMLDGRKEKYVLIASDIKGFKFINEALGYTQGDNILRMFADMITQNGREYNCYTRVSADLFLTLEVCQMERDSCVRMIQRLDDEFCQMQNRIFPEVNLMIRSGIYFIEDECTGIETAIDRATIARKSMDYIIKSTAVVYNDGTFGSSFRENEIINRMEYALKHEEFKVYLQPKFSLKDNRLTGAEALVRWRREDGSVMNPGEFLPLFEKNGFISQVDHCVFLQVCRTLRGWMDKGVAPVCISVNLSGMDINQDSILTDILEGTKDYGIDHKYLEFELTETAFLKDTERTFHVMKVLRESGFITSIDDFGSGYSIMNMMADIPCDVIKLDCGFVQSCQNTERGRGFLRQLIQMTNKMGFVSLCEGIETEEQLRMVSDMGCSIGQGYYFARPMPIDEFYEKFCKKSIDKK